MVQPFFQGSILFSLESALKKILMKLNLTPPPPPPNSMLPSRMEFKSYLIKVLIFSCIIWMISLIFVSILLAEWTQFSSLVRKFWVRFP